MPFPPMVKLGNLKDKTIVSFEKDRPDYQDNCTFIRIIFTDGSELRIEAENDGEMGLDIY